MGHIEVFDDWVEHVLLVLNTAINYTLNYMWTLTGNGKVWMLTTNPGKIVRVCIQLLGGCLMIFLIFRLLSTSSKAVATRWTMNSVAVQDVVPSKKPSSRVKPAPKRAAAVKVAKNARKTPLTPMSLSDGDFALPDVTITKRKSSGGDDVPSEGIGPKKTAAPKKSAGKAPKSSAAAAKKAGKATPKSSAAAAVKKKKPAAKKSADTVETPKVGVTTRRRVAKK